MRRTIGLGLVMVGLVVAAGGCSGGTKTTPTMPEPSHTPWMLIESGSVPPSAIATWVSPTPSVSGTTSAAAVTTSPTPTPSVTNCSADGPDLNAINGATATTTATSGTVSWFNPGGSAIVEYRVTAISQDLVTGVQRDVGWTVITPGASCGYMSATVTGLDSKTHYVFSVDVVEKQDGLDGTRAATIARTGVTETQ